MRWRWGWQEMKVKWAWKWDENYLTGTQDGERTKREEERRNQERTPTPTHLARGGRTLERQGKRKSGGRRKQTKTSGGGGGRTRLNQPQRNLRLPKHARTQTYLERGSTHEIEDQWGPSWWKNQTKKDSVPCKYKVVRCSHYRIVLGPPTNEH